MKVIVTTTYEGLDQKTLDQMITKLGKGRYHYRRAEVKCKICKRSMPVSKVVT
jgi:hypothetical protein